MKILSQLTAAVLFVSAASVPQANAMELPETQVSQQESTEATQENSTTTELSWFGYECGSQAAAISAQSLLNGDTIASVLTLLPTLTNAAPATIASITAALLDLDLSLDIDSLIATLMTIPAAVAGDRIGDGNVDCTDSVLTEGEQPAQRAETQMPQSPEDLPLSTEDPTVEGGAALAASQPKESKRGESKAVAFYKWLLHGKYDEKIYYGTCNIFVCTTHGYALADFSTNVQIPSEGMKMFWYISSGSGELPYFTDLKATLKRDISNLGDTSHGTYNCTSSTTCTGSRPVPEKKGHWYYLQLNFKIHHGGHASKAQIQTRRAKVIGSQNMEYPSYQYGG